MLVQLTGMIMSGLISLIIAHFYYKKASKDLLIQTNNFRTLNDELKSLLIDLNELDSNIIEDTREIRKITRRGTSEDPDFPYK